MSAGSFDDWVQDFQAAAQRRRLDGDPDWSQGAQLGRAVAASVQRFQVGEDGDGAHLVAKAQGAGDATYTAALRLFVAEEQNHARLLALLLSAADTPTLASHWSDAVFVRLRRALGLRLELVVLVVAEVIGLRYYRFLRDGSTDALTREVVSRIIADEERHVPFHCQRLRIAFAAMPRLAQRLAVAGWWLLLWGVTVTVAADHGRALRRLGVTRRQFVAGVTALFRAVAADVLSPGLPAAAGSARAGSRSGP